LRWRWLLSRELLLYPGFVRLLLVFYIPGTIYGYFWYGEQLAETWRTRPLWQIVFVPDSPTASLLFAIALLWGLVSRDGFALGDRTESLESGKGSPLSGIRPLVEALGVVTSFKYGVWACIVIFAGWAQGDAVRWEHWMLITGHAAMAVFALLYAPHFRFGKAALAAAAVWTLANDTMDYGLGIHPYLPWQLEDDLLAVAAFTFALTGLSVLISALARRFPAASARASS
jgi:uncharacterized membrane protein YpjA